MSYNFKEFQNTGPVKDVRISINKSGEITFPSKFCYENRIFSYGYASTFWDEEKKAIGIRFTNKKEGNVYTIQRSSKGGGARISSKGFLRANKIDLSLYSGRYPWKRYEDSNFGILYVFELNRK